MEFSDLKDVVGATDEMGCSCQVKAVVIIGSLLLVATSLVLNYLKDIKTTKQERATNR